MEHDDYVKKMISKLEEEGATKIYAHKIDGYSSPREIGGFIPDISAHFGGLRKTYEIETEETISIEHTKEQCIAFANRASDFTVCVPKSSETEMRANLGKWGISAKTKIYCL